MFPNEKKIKKIIIILFFYLLIDLTSFASILPVLPSLVYSFSLEKNDVLYNAMNNVSENFREYFNVPTSQKWNIVLFGGLLGSSFSIFQFIFSPLIGALSDSFGRKTMLMITSTGMVFSNLIWCLSKNNFTIFFISRIFGGICKSNIVVSVAIVGDVYEKEHRNIGMALIGIAFSLGFIFGPLIGVAAGTYQNVSTVSVILNFLNVLMIWSLFPETLLQSNRVVNFVEKLSSVIKFINPLSIFLYTPMSNLKYRDLQKARRLGFAYFMYLFVYSGMEFTLTFLTFIRFNYTNIQQGRMFLFIGIIMIIVQGAFVRRLKSGQEQLLTIVGITALLPGFCLLGYSHSILYFYIGLLLFAFASGCVVSCLTTMISQCDNVNSPRQGLLMGIFRSQGCLARGLGPLFASVVFWLYGPQVTYTIGAFLMIIPLMGLTSLNQ